jgi:hypothetical protein
MTYSHKGISFGQILHADKIFHFTKIFHYFFPGNACSKMVPFSLPRYFCSRGCKRPRKLTKLTLVLYLLFLQTQALHCHRKHDHSSDVLLKSDISTLGGSRGRHSHHHSNDGSNETLGDAAKLVQLEDRETDISSEDISNLNVSKSYVGGVNVTRTGGGGKVVSFCPARCHCDITTNNQLQVVCQGHFVHDFPLDKLRKDVEILQIEPELKCVKLQGHGKSETCNR